jgi:hypothetical protein
VSELKDFGANELSFSGALREPTKIRRFSERFLKGQIR